MIVFLRRHPESSLSTVFSGFFLFFFFYSLFLFLLCWGVVVVVLVGFFFKLFCIPVDLVVPRQLQIRVPSLRSFWSCVQVESYQ